MKSVQSILIALCLLLFQGAFDRVGVALAGEMIKGQATNVVVKNIVFSRETGRKERVCILFGTDAVPQVSALSGDSPRVVIDIDGVSSWDGFAKQAVGGRFIHTIRSHLHQDKQMLRIVLDLAEEGDYSVTQTYFQKEKLFCLSVYGK